MEVKVWSRQFVQSALEHLGDKFFNDFILISINDRIGGPTSDKLLVSEELGLEARPEECLNLRFGDITPENRANGGILFNRSDAAQIVSFVDSAKLRGEIRNIVVHCHAGVSRSGAVGEFIAEVMLGISEADFLKTNPHVFPNRWVLQVIRSYYDDLHRRSAP